MKLDAKHEKNPEVQETKWPGIFRFALLGARAARRPKWLVAAASGQRPRAELAATVEIDVCHDRDTWNAAIALLKGSLYHSWQWGELRQSLGWQAWRILATHEGRPVAAAQILERRLPVLGSLFYGIHGIACPDVTNLPPVLAWLREFLAQRNAILLRLDPRLSGNHDERKAVLLRAGLRARTDQWTVWNLPRATMMVDLRPTEPELLLNMRSKHREHICRATRAGLAFLAGDGPEELRQLYSVVSRSSERQGFAMRDFSYFEELRRHLLRGGRGMIFLARKDGVPIAGILCSIFGDTAYYLYGGFDYNARQYHPNEYLHFSAFKWAKANGCHWYNMSGAGTAYPPKQGNSGFGLYNFKKGFGAKLCYSDGYFDLVENRVAAGIVRLAEHCADPVARIVNFVRGVPFLNAVRKRVSGNQPPAMAES
ncbi:MAG: lipid II:glycine glycyltransferase FemX [Terriglobales bacterium]